MYKVITSLIKSLIAIILCHKHLLEGKQVLDQFNVTISRTNMFIYTLIALFIKCNLMILFSEKFNIFMLDYKIELNTYIRKIYKCFCVNVFVLII